MPCLCPRHLSSGSTGSSPELCDECLELFATDDITSILKSRSGLKFMRQPYDPTKMKCGLCFFLSARYFKKSFLFPNNDGGDDDFWLLRKFLSWLGWGRLTCRVTGDLRTEEPLKVTRWDGWWPLKKRYLKLSASRGKFSTYLGFTFNSVRIF